MVSEEKRWLFCVFINPSVFGCEAVSALGELLLVRCQRQNRARMVLPKAKKQSGRFRKLRRFCEIERFVIG